MCWFVVREGVQVLLLVSVGLRHVVWILGWMCGRMFFDYGSWFWKFVVERFRPGEFWVGLSVAFLSQVLVSVCSMG